MTQSMGTLDFFLLEGGEYLERLDVLAQTPAGAFAQGEELLRLTRAFRGSAIMASQHGMARAALGLEAVARAVREGRIPWSEATRGELIRAVDDSKVLMRRLRTPDQGDTEKAEAIGIALDRLSGRASAAMRAQAGPGLDAGGRAFVAREAASIASVLQNVARTLRADPGNRDILVSVPPAMSALRGVAILNDLPPLADILSAIEHGTKDVLAAAGSVPDAADMFDAGGKALARAAREVVDAGRPDANAEESHAFAARLFSALAGRGGVVSVESLFFDDDGPHIVKQGAAPAPAGAGLARVEMVSHGEYLTAAAAGLGRAETPVQRDLRLYGIAASVRPMMGAGGSPLSNALGRLAEAARDAIGRGAASHAIGDFTANLNKAAQALASAQSGDETALAERLAAAASGIAALTLRSRTVAVAPPPPQPEPVKPVVVSRISDPTMPRQSGDVPVAPGASPAPPAPPPPPDSALGNSYLTLERLIGDKGLPLGSLDELVGDNGKSAAAKAPAAAPAPAPAKADDAVRISQRVTPPRYIEKMSQQPVVPVQSLAPDEDVVPIESLLYSSDAALLRLKELKAQLAEATKVEIQDSARLAALIHEVFDLVELGLASRR